MVLVNTRTTEEGDLLAGLAFVRGVTRAGSYTLRSLDQRGQRLKVRLSKELVTFVPGCWVDETLEVVSG